MYFILEINRTNPILCQGLNLTKIGITGTLIVTLPQYNMGYNFPPGLSHSHYRLCFAFRHIVGITGRPLCNDPLHYTHKLCTITYPYMQCSHPQCSDHVSGLNTLRAWSTSCSTRATLEANSWITNCIFASCFCSSYIIYICIGVIHWVHSCSEIKTLLFQHILRVDSADSICKCNLLAWNLLDFKIIQLYCKLLIYILIDWMVHLVKSD